MVSAVSASEAIFVQIPVLHFLPWSRQVHVISNQPPNKIRLADFSISRSRWLAYRGRSSSNDKALPSCPARPRNWCNWPNPKLSAYSINITVASGTFTPTSTPQSAWLAYPARRPQFLLQLFLRTGSFNNPSRRWLKIVLDNLLYSPPPIFYHYLIINNGQ